MGKDKNPSVGAREAAELSGLSMAMLDYLSRTDLLVPSGEPRRCRGLKRKYTFADVIFLRVISELLSRGVEVRRLRRSLQAAHADATTWIDIRRQPRDFLVTDGTEIFVANKGTLESKTTNRQYAFAFVLNLASHHRAVAKIWPRITAARRSAA
jgi:DNA-binding transcriptional MerR regulator